MRIGKIASDAEYRMDKQFQNLLIFQFRKFQKVLIWKISQFTKDAIIAQLKKFRNFQNWTIWEIKIFF